MKINAKDGIALYKLGVMLTEASDGSVATSDKNREHFESVLHNLVRELNASAEVVTVTMMVHTRTGGNDTIGGCVIGKAPLVHAMMIALSGAVDEGAQEAVIQQSQDSDEVCVVTPENVH